MVLILCLNAAVDKTVVVDDLRLRRLNRPARVVTLPGGKGINVARVLAGLGERPLVLGFTAGYTGDFIERGLREEGISARWLRLARGHSRMCLAMLDGGGAPTELNEAGAVVGGPDLARLTSVCGRLSRAARLVVMSGSLPPGCPAGTYSRLIREVRRHGRMVFLDTSGPALKAGLAAGPDLVKLNREEAAFLGLPVRRTDALARALEALASRGPGARSRGPRAAIVTLGPAGAVAYFGGRRLVARPPRVRSVSPVGCGDTFLAGLANEILSGAAPERALAFATALATASALVPGAGVVRAADVGPILKRVRVRVLSA